MSRDRVLWPLGALIGLVLSPAFSGSFLERGRPVVWGDTSSPIKSDERVDFFPTYGQLTPDGKAWELRVHGWIYEPIQESTLRRASLAALRLALGLESGEADTGFFLERAALFLTDNERGKKIPVRFGDKVVRLAASRGNGHFEMLVTLPVDEVEELLATRDEPTSWLEFSAVVPDGDSRRFEGRVLLMPDTGLSVISDIDDTIKVSQVADPRALVRNTFLRQYEAVPGMSAEYRRLAGDGARFHYLSNSPWQLYPPLSRFFEAQRFPRGTYHMRPFRLKDSSIVDFLGSPEKHKRATLETLLRRFPDRRFILIGDTGERDPEIYGDFGRRFPEEVRLILLRDPSGDGSVTPRIEAALRDIAAEKWQVFADASEINWRGAVSEG